VIHFFTLNELKARAIHTELESVYEPEAAALPIVKKLRRRFHPGKTDQFDDSRSMRNDLVRAIDSMVEERPFSLCNALCRHFQIGKATCLWILHNKLGLKKIPSSLGAPYPIDQTEE
jgi:hypothetical protein